MIKKLHQILNVEDTKCRVRREQAINVSSGQTHVVFWNTNIAFFFHNINIGSAFLKFENS